MYLIILFGSFFGICLMVALRVIVRHRRVRRFVMSVRQRLSVVKDEAKAGDTLDCTRAVTPSASSSILRQVSSLVRDAEKALSQNRMEEAERLFIAALTLCPTARNVQVQLAKLFLITNRDAKAEAMYAELLQGYGDASSYANLGLACYRQGKYEDACAAYERALQHEQKSPERMSALGKAYIAAQRFADAATCLEKAAAQLPRDAELLRLLAECFQQLGEIQKAEEVYRRLNRLEPYDQEVKAKILELAKA